MRVRDFEIIAEHFIEPDFQARDSGPGDLVGLILGHPLLASGRQIAERVELGVKAAADQSAVAAGQRAVVDQRRFEPGANLGAQIQLGFETVQQRTAYER